MADCSGPRLGHDILYVFDVRQDSRDFLADVIESLGAPTETDELLRQSLMAGAEDWQNLVDCATSIRWLRGNNEQSLDGQDVLAYVWQIFNGINASSSLTGPWEQTDRLIAQARALERDPEIRPPLPSTIPVERSGGDRLATSSQPRSKSKGRAIASHYWLDQPQEEPSRESRKRDGGAQSHSTRVLSSIPFVCYRGRFSVLPERAGATPLDAKDQGEVQHSQNYGQSASTETWRLLDVPDEPDVAVKRLSKVSPYFSLSTSAAQGNRSPVKPRAPPGTVATVPFAPLTSPKFGIIQEKFAHDPFWLLIAVTFLIKTHGKLAIPTFYRVKERFPSPEHVADPANAEELAGMIRHLGLSMVRVAFMQKYARGFLNDPPKAGVRYKVKNYDCRDVDPSRSPDNSFTIIEPGPSKLEGDTDDREAWEIGHLTKGKYAIDSWRIFCRDQLLGRAEDWNGKGREPEFQPEWMRVMPADKELRAYLRWMWMREGWEWSPFTAERTVLREEMMRAVNEGRVEYDETGDLRIVDASGEDSTEWTEDAVPGT
ncbi:hypothetical protein AK830_g7604 [Neonectria ditissima]|uniref:HhH-GPD domain-containing protein n=1 Tax=Neonectria ditissima TaxID=78410 RepID=A0A0P7BFW4_9HYPO|nr:hypothetical protein AK830_g7604 [Neonectria ditissima]